MALTENETLILLNRVAAGDQAAVRELYRAYAPIVKDFLKGRGWEPSLVEDAVHVAAHTQERFNEWLEEVADIPAPPRPLSHQ